ncbi:hypothetical protein [Blastococcus haudaquaticus]|uniref:Excreted virulence factor EspC, type VII ESX diderm n=1 Tax=Blastococcus haudaquaticus TaxID=1938745 RepID=A0A286H108_9ACTN|nr:hypothetical protein [Blastococcus haudaquaticus]SOE01468.1 hypothetical protein SAMN06272739_3178 [Blastococcus haudaquaticus]
MSDRLVVDLAALEEAGRQLDSLGREFQQAGDIADDARAAVGHAGLSSRLGEFVDGWKVRREDYLEDMTYLAELTHQAASTYREVDDQLAAAFEETGQ